MKTILAAIIILSVLASCSQGPSDEVTLIFPTGRYTDWTNFELMHMAFRLKDGQLKVDSNYKFESKQFNPGGIEKAVDFPATSEFLTKSLTDYRILSQELTDTICRPTSVYIQIKGKQGTDLIYFQTLRECDSERDTLSGIALELHQLQEKYARKSARGE